MPMILTGFLYSYFFADIKASLLGAGIIFILMLFMALKGGVGGGDIWYSTALGAWFGMPAIWYILFIGSFLAIISNFVMYFKKGKLKVKLNEIKSQIILFFIFRDIKKAGFKELPENDDEINDDVVPYGFYLALGTVIFWFLTAVTKVVHLN